MKNILVVLLLAFVLVACGKKGDGPKGDKNSSTAGKTDSDAGGDQKHKFGIKSGIVEMKNSMMSGMKQTMYFDDYGNKQAVMTSMEMGGQKTENVQLTIDGYSTSYDLQKKTGTRRKVSGPAGGMPALSEMTDSMKKEYKLQEIEAKEVAGKQCKGYSMEVMGMKAKIWVYQDVPLYMQMEMGKTPMIVEATSIQEDASVPADKFTVPADVKITDADAAGMPPGGGHPPDAGHADTTKH